MYMQENNFKLTKAKQLTLINSSLVTITFTIVTKFHQFLCLQLQGPSDPREFQIFEQPGLCRLSLPIARVWK